MCALKIFSYQPCISKILYLDIPLKTHFSFKVRPVIVHFLVSLFYLEISGTIHFTWKIDKWKKVMIYQFTCNFYQTLWSTMNMISNLRLKKCLVFNHEILNDWISGSFSFLDFFLQIHLNDLLWLVLTNANVYFLNILYLGNWN